MNNYLGGFYPYTPNSGEPKITIYRLIKADSELEAITKLNAFSIEYCAEHKKTPGGLQIFKTL